tara:strand:+ start:95 stop:481 length:387 start_codon:yes stop_codon:yes gene_type:complete
MNFKHEIILEYIKDDLDEINDILNEGDFTHYTEFINEIHHQLFNEYNYVNSYKEAMRWIGKDADVLINMQIFVKNHEIDNYGEPQTDITQLAKLVNSYVYIKGEEILNEKPMTDLLTKLYRSIDRQTN